jgi:1-acyl-sn-glycerol-3-phosphate acyltransferase
MVMEQEMIRKINRYWRILATGFCFLCFSMGGLLLTLTVLPLIRLICADQTSIRNLTQSTVHHSFRLFVWMMQTCGVIRVNIIGGKNLNEYSNHLIIANHPCLIDVVVIISLTKKTGCIVKQSLWQNPFMRSVVSSAGYIMNSDPPSLMNACTDYMRAGNSLLIFPEGTRTPTNLPVKFQRGTANIAIRAEKDILPIIITCNPQSLKKNERWYDVPENDRINITLRLGDAISISPFLEDTHPIAARKLTRFLENYYQQEILRNEQFNTRDQRIDYRLPGSRGYNP